MNLTTLSQSKPAAAALLLISAIIFHAPLIFGDLAHPTRDFYLHYSWVEQIAQSLQEGNWYPRWMPLAAEGLGQPVFYYYSPLFHLAAGWLSQATTSHWTAMKLVVIGASWLTGWVTYAFVRRHAAGPWALLAAGCLQFTPLMAVVFWRLGGWPWYASFPFFLVLLYRTVEFSKRGGRLDPVISLATALLAATHVLSAFVALLCLPVAVVWGCEGERNGRDRVRALGWWSGSCLPGLGLAAIYLYPALTTLSLISPGRWGGGDLDWHSSFAFSAITALQFGVRWPVFQWVVPLFVFAPVAVAVFYLRTSTQHGSGARSLIRKLIVVSGVAFFFSSEVSYPIWKIFNPLQLVQFPSRFLFVATAASLLANFLCVAPIAGDGNAGTRRRFLVAPIGASLLAAFVVTGYLTVTALEPVKPSEISPLGPTVAEYMPATAGAGWSDYVARGGLKHECESRGVRCETIADESQRRAWEIETPGATSVRLPVFAFPSWNLSVDGATVQDPVDLDSGLLQAAVPAGSHRLELTWAGLPEERTGATVSLIAGLFWVGLCVVGWQRSRGGKTGGHGGPPARPNL